MPLWTDDKVLSALASRDDPVGSLVRAFPGASEATEGGPWLRSWVERRVQGAVNGGRVPTVQVTASEADGVIDHFSRAPVTEPVRLRSLSVRYFRGFREPECPIDLDADLLVVHGKNSTGKTSLTEALEWVTTGRLSRREAGYGHPRELDCCITNEFCPSDSKPYVELWLRVGTEEHRLRRELLEDYGTAKSSKPKTVAYLDDRELSEVEDRRFFDRILAGVHPFLMQHTLRQFVHDDPENRRRYFERLLEIDELTALISKAVLGDAALEEIVSPSGGRGLADWRALRGCVSAAFSPSILDTAEKADEPALAGAVETALAQVAQAEFSGVPEGVSLREAESVLTLAQTAERDRELPVLTDLRPKQSLPSTEGQQKVLLPDADVLRVTQADYLAAVTAASALSEGQLAVAGALQSLITAGLLDANAVGDVTCPLCLADPPTLTPDRRRDLLEWSPVRQALEAGDRRWCEVREAAMASLSSLERRVADAAPPFPSETDIAPPFKDAFTKVKAVREAADRDLADIRTTISEFREALGESGEADWEEQTTRLSEALVKCERAAAAYAAAVVELDELAASSARQDAEYRIREAWLRSAGDVRVIVEDLLWARARDEVNSLLKNIRSGLIELRARLIEGARDQFSADMSEIWNVLRSDRSSAFERLDIPPARGRGFKLEFEVLAKLDGGDEVKEVNALKVFSESQVNVVGLAAYVTRAKRLGHTSLIFDDPVQSMDEDHFNTFSSAFLDRLLTDGYQIIVLTHSDVFASRISYFHYHRDAYCTLTTRRSRRTGCHVEEGTRRVAERLRVAEKLTDEGHFDDAWVRVRLAVERVYTLVKTRADPEFNPEGWRDMDAVHMWDHGAGEIIAELAPDAGPRLRQILKFAAAGAHDKGAVGETDLREAIEFLKTLTNRNLRLGAG